MIYGAKQYLPRSLYHIGLFMNSLTSRRILSEMPLSKTTEEIGLRLRGWPNGLHSEPKDVYTMVLPSLLVSASCRAIYTECKI